MINKKNEQNKSNENFYIKEENIQYLKKKLLIDNNDNIQSSDIQNNKNDKQSNNIKNNINNSKNHNQRKNRQNNSNLNQIYSAFDNYDLQKLAYSLVKDYSLIQINKDEKF